MVRMKKIWMLCTMTIFILVLAACGGSNNQSAGNTEQPSNTNDGGTAEQSQEPINLRLTTGLSPSDGNTAAFTHPWMELVEERTNGLVTFDAFFSQELVPMGEEIRALQDGTVDLAAPILPTYEPARYPLSDVTLLPLLHSDVLIAQKAFADLIKSDVVLQDGKTFTDLEYGAHNMKALPVQPTPEYTIGAIKHEFNTVDSLKNLRLRAAGRAHEIFIQELGSSPVSMPFSEEFEAMNRGAIEGTVRSVLDYGPYGFDEMLTNALSGISLGHFPFVWIMSLDKWNSLPEDVQKVMEETAYELSESTEKLEAQNNAIEAAKNGGITFTPVSELDPAAQELIEAASLATWEAWIAAKESEGLPGKETAILWRDLIIKNGGSVHDSIMELQ